MQWTHKLLVFSDVHLTEEDAPIIGLSPSDRFDELLSQALSRHQDASALILLGDVAHHGAVDAYERLKAKISHLPFPVIPMLGNHDNRETFRQVFTDAPSSLGGFVQHSQEMGDWTLVTLDTLDGPPYPDGQHSGLLCKDRLDWLNAQLENAKNRPVLVAAHHHPFLSGLPGMDRINLTNGDELLQALKNHGNCHLICGHIHRTISGCINGVPWAVFKSTCHQAPMDLSSPDTTLSVDEPGGYGVVLLAPDGAIIHNEEIERAEVIEDYHSKAD